MKANRHQPKNRPGAAGCIPLPGGFVPYLDAYWVSLYGYPGRGRGRPPLHMLKNCLLHIAKVCEHVDTSCHGIMGRDGVQQSLVLL